MLSDLDLRRSESALRIRRAGAEDRATLARLAALDSAEAPEGEVLIAEADGEAVAAAPLAGGPAIADPFRYTADIVGLLELRAAQMRAAARGLEVSGPAGAALPRRA